MKKRNLLICFLGIDGSGKSTLSQSLLDELKKQDISVRRIWWLEAENSLLRRVLRAGRKNPASQSGASLPQTPSRGVARAPRMRPLRSLYASLVLLDYLRFGLSRTWPPRFTGRPRILIFDRFFGDVVQSLSREFELGESRRERLFRLFGALLPKPDLAFMILVEPAVAYSRKKEEILSVDNAQTKLDDYRELEKTLKSLLGWKILDIDNSGDIEKARSIILNTAFELVQSN